MPASSDRAVDHIETEIETSNMTRSATLIAAAAIVLLSSAATWGQGLLETTVPSEGVTWHDLGLHDLSVALWETPSGAFYAVAKKGVVLTSRRRDPLVRLRGLAFDPTVSSPKVAETLRADETMKLRLVQFATQTLPEYGKILEGLGATPLQRFPFNAMAVRGDREALSALVSLPFVRWTGPLHPAYKLPAGIRDDLQRNRLLAPRWYNIHVTRSGLAEKSAVADAIRSDGGEVHDYVSPHGFLLRARLSGLVLLNVIRRDDVLFVDPWGPEEPDMDIVRQVGGADAIEAAEGYTGAGVRAQVRDTGLDFGHTDWRFAPMPHGGTSGSQNHGTAVYGIVFGDGAGNSQARGLLPDAQGVFHSSSTTVDRFVETSELLQAPYRCVFETNSTGSPRTTEYTNISADMDNILFLNDVVVLQSQSNAGSTSEPRDSRPEAWAKNIISVGGIRHFNTATTADDAWNGAGSIGPAADGRIKPDLCMFYDSILTADVTGSGGYSSSNYTSGFGGTSGATPICAGFVGLFHQMWADGIFGNALTSWDVFDNKPHASLARAFMINGASPYPFSGAADDLTRVHQGWGRPDVAHIYDRRDRVFWVNETDVLTNLQTTSYILTVPAGETEFHATMVYRDPPGTPNAAVHRINDLTLKVTDPMGTVYWGNNGLLLGTTSTPGGSANMLDPVENVIVTNPLPGSWTVEVIAADVNQDGHPATPAVDAVYALVVSGVTPPNPPTPDVGQANSADGSLEVRDALNLNGQKPKIGIPGPFFVSRSPGESLELNFKGPAGRPFALLSGPLNRNNGVFTGAGSLDLGLLGGQGDFSDVILLIDGVFPSTFLDQLANVGPSGSQTFSFPVPSVNPGVLGSIQALFWDVPTATLTFSAATEITVL